MEKWKNPEVDLHIVRTNEVQNPALQERGKGNGRGQERKEKWRVGEGEGMENIFKLQSFELLKTSCCIRARYLFLLSTISGISAVIHA